MVVGAPDDLSGWLEDLHLGAARRDAVLRAAHNAPTIAGELRPDMRPSEVHALLATEPPETLALTRALGAPVETNLAEVRLEITGDDLIAAGIPAGPAIGRALDHALRRKLDGEISGRDEELAAALEAER